MDAARVWYIETDSSKVTIEVADRINDFSLGVVNKDPNDVNEKEN